MKTFFNIKFKIPAWYSYILRESASQATVFFIFRLVGDNIYHEIRAWIQCKEHHNQSIHWTHMYAIKDSVVNILLDNSKPQKKKEELQLDELLPTPNVMSRLADSWSALVSRVITTYLEKFKFLKNSVIHHIPHLYTKEATSKSEVVSIH